MKSLKYITSMTAAAAICLGMTSCEGEKDLIIIDGNLPIKTSTLYLVGDATPSGWSIDSPTPMEASDEDPLVFTWEGPLKNGELKLCLTPGSFENAFIRPMTAGTEISSIPIVDAEFKMHAGDPDDKWVVTEAGTYFLTFDLRNWRMSSELLEAAPPAEIVPIVTDELYMVGDATPVGWNIDSPLKLEKISEFIFRYHGNLNAGEMKACATPGSWDVPFIRPEKANVEIGKDGVADPNFVYSAGDPDNKWLVKDPGTYTIEFDLENWTISATRTGDIQVDNTPIETDDLFMIGDATPGGWGMNSAQVFKKESKYIFSWEGELTHGTFKACIERDDTYSCPFIRPSEADVEVNSKGVAANDFVFTVSPDHQWKVTESGTYHITFDLEHHTIAVKMTAAGNDDPEPEPGVTPIETSTLIMIGDATPGGWSMDNATSFTQDANDKYIFTWEGALSTGPMKACLKPDGTFSCPFIRPATDGVKINRDGVEQSGFIFTAGDPDNKWNITEAGTYRITFNLRDWTIDAKFID